jgi:hypothetical protein
MAAGAASARSSGIFLPRKAQRAEPGNSARIDGVRPRSLRLEIANVDPLATDDRLGRVVLRDDAGAPSAYGGAAAGRFWIRVPEVGYFELSIGADEVRASIPSGVSRELVLDGYHSIALPLFTQAVLGYEVLHASAVLVEGCAVAFCAKTGVGKSTISSSLSRRGFSLWADDAVGFVSETGRFPGSVFLPFTVGGRSVSPPGGRDQVPLATVCLLERLADDVGDGPIAISRPSASHAVAALIAHGYRFAPQPQARRRKMVQRYLEVAARVPMLLVRFAPEQDHLPKLLDRIESAFMEAISERR